MKIDKSNKLTDDIIKNTALHVLLMLYCLTPISVSIEFFIFLSNLVMLEIKSQIKNLIGRPYSISLTGQCYKLKTNYALY